MKAVRFVLFALLCACVLTFSALAAGSDRVREVTAVFAEEGLSPAAPLSRSALEALLPGADAAPSLPLTRARFADILCLWLDRQMLVLPEDGSDGAADLDWTVSYHVSAETLLRGGVMGTDENGCFRPGELITNAEAAVALGRLFTLCGSVDAGQPANSLPCREALPIEAFDDSCMVGHSNIVGLQNSLKTPMDMVAQVGAAAYYFLQIQDLSFENGYEGSMVKGLSRRNYERIYLMLGTNDMASLGCAYVDAFTAKMQQIIDVIRAMQPQAELYLLSVTPCGVESPWMRDEAICYSQAIKSLSREQSLPYIDISTPLTAPLGGIRSEYAREDGLHFVKRGYEVILEQLLTHYTEAGHV